MTTNQTIALQKTLIDSLWREIGVARNRATRARQEATFAEERLNKLLRQMIHAGVAPVEDEIGGNEP